MSIEKDTIGRGAIAGAIAYFLGYLVTYLWKAQEIEEAIGPFNTFANFFGADPIPAWKIVGWLFYSAHFVESRISLGPAGPRYVNLIDNGEGAITLLYVLPPLLLLGAGWLISRRPSTIGNRTDSMKHGALVVAGYLPLTVIGVFLFRVNDSGPTLIPALLQVGIVYPVVFGALGGLIATRW